MKNDFIQSSSELEKEMNLKVQQALEIGENSTYEAHPRYPADGRKVAPSQKQRQSSMQLSSGYG